MTTATRCACRKLVEEYLFFGGLDHAAFYSTQLRQSIIPRSADALRVTGCHLSVAPAIQWQRLRKRSTVMFGSLSFATISSLRRLHRLKIAAPCTAG